MIYRKAIKLYQWLGDNNFITQKEELRKIIVANNLLPATSGQISSDTIRNLFSDDLESTRQSESFDVDSIKTIFDEAKMASSVESDVLNRSRVISPGFSDSTGDDFIEKVQAALKGLGYYVSGDSSGYFGSMTKKALIAFQKNNHNLGPFTEGRIDNNVLTGLRNPSAKKEETEPAEAQVLIPSSNTLQPASLGLGEYILPNLAFKSAPCTNCATKARQESETFWGNGTVIESDRYFSEDGSAEEDTVENTLMKYWRYTSDHNGRERNIDRWGQGGVRERGPRAGDNRVNPVKERDEHNVAKEWHHWSAVFTSYVMGLHDGEGAKWFVSESHKLYEDAFKKMRKEIERSPQKHIGKFYYLWFSTQEMNKHNISLDLGDLVGNAKHYDIYVGSGQVIGGNTCAKNEYTDGVMRNCVGTSGTKPLRFMADGGIIKRVEIIGNGQNLSLV